MEQVNLLVKQKYDLFYCIGDSFTVGASQADDVNGEVTIENRFSNLVANYYGLECVNHAVAGTNNNYIARTAYFDILKFKSQSINPLIFIGYTSPSRTEIYSNKTGTPVTMNHENVTYYKEYMVDNYSEQYILDCTRYNVLSVRTLLKYCKFDFVDAWVFYSSGKHNDELLEIPYLDNQEELSTPLFKIAGDDRFKFNNNYGHPTPVGHQKIANIIIEKINTLYGTSKSIAIS